MAIVEIQTARGMQQVKVCDYCKTVCCQSQFCSGHCYRNYYERLERNAAAKRVAVGKGEPTDA